MPKRRRGAFVPALRPAFQKKTVSFASQGKVEALTRRANVIPASNAPKNMQKPRKKEMQNLRDFLCA